MATGAIVAAALGYAARGWRVLHLKPKDKIPLVTNWQRDATTNEETIARWWTATPQANVGVAMGETTGLIDFECDSPEEEAIYCQLFDGDPPATATFQSNRGKHYLFKWRPGLPQGALATLKGAGPQDGAALKVRIGNGRGAQSMFPPSIHPVSKKPYKWLCDPDEVPPADLTDAVVERLFLWDSLGSPPGLETTQPDKIKPQKTPEQWAEKASGVGEGERNQTAAELAGKLLRNAAELNQENVNVIWFSLQGWNSQCRPPQDLKDLEKTFQSILRLEKLRRSKVTTPTQAAGPGRKEVDPQPQQEKGRGIENWKLSYTLTDPSWWILTAPEWTGTLILTSPQLLQFSHFRLQALEQLKVHVPVGMCKYWDNAVQQLVAGAEAVEGLPVTDDLQEAADHLLVAVTTAAPAGDLDKPDRWRCVRRADGTVWFHWPTLMSRAIKEYGLTPRAVRRLRWELGISRETERFVSGVWYAVIDQNLEKKLKIFAGWRETETSY